jgi:glycerol-3-phosphate acyltransferase PlsX
LGLNGIVIKSHGGADAEGFAAAIELGHGVVRDELLAKITAALGRPGKPPLQAVGGVAS